MKDPADGLLLSPALADDEKDWTIGDLVELDPEERVGVRCRFRDLQESCRFKRRKVPGSVSGAVGLAVELVDDAAVATSPCAGSSSHARFDELTQELSITRTEVVSLTA